MLCLEDKDIDLFISIVEHGTGHLRIRPGTARVAVPSYGEELRLRQRLIAVAWLMCRSKHKNCAWLSADLLDAFRRLSDFVLGKFIAGHPIMSGNGTRRPAWKLVLSFEQECRKKAYQLVRLHEAETLAAALDEACKSPELLNFLMPLTTSTEFLSVAFDGMPGPDGWVSRGKGKGKGKHGKGKEGKSIKKLFLKTKKNNGKCICFKFNNGKCSDPSVCGFEHVCQICRAWSWKEAVSP